jgi:hypothetical protein
MKVLLGVVTLVSLSRGSEAFSPVQPATSSTRSLVQSCRSSPNALLTTPLFAEKEKSKKPFDEGLRTKLVSESIAPWRTLRLFLYTALGAGAFIGGLVNLSGTAAAISGARSDVDMNTEYINLAIDFGAVAVFAFLTKFDLDKQKDLNENVEKKIELKKQQKQLVKGMKEREKQLATLNVEIQVSATGDTKQASVRQLQAGARQHMIVVAGPKKATRDALIGANLLKMDFAMSNVLVVPFETDVTEADRLSRPEGGFGERPMYETQPYVAQAVGEGWQEYIKSEMSDAVKQNGEKVKEEGIAIVVASTGKIIRRGVGKVPWRQMVEQLQASTKEKEGSGLLPF